MSSIIGNIAQIVAGGKGLRFDVIPHKAPPGLEGESIPCFVIKYKTHFYAYLNRCGHIAVQLDYLPGQFFTDDGETLMCATHGAEYAPDTGACLGGPCFGVGLEPIEIAVENDTVVLTDSRYSLVSS